MLTLGGWFLVGAVVVSGNAGAWQLYVGVMALVLAVACTLELRHKCSLVRFLASSLVVLVASPFMLVGALLFVVYPAAAALRGLGL